MIITIKKFSSIRHSLNRIFHDFIFGNFFIATCITGLIFTTFLLNGIPIAVTPFTLFLTLATFLHYNLHRLSFNINFSGKKNIFHSVKNLRINKWEKFFFFVATLSLIICAFFIPLKVYLYLIPLSILTLAYSIPFVPLKGNWHRLSDFYFIKIPLVSFVWAFSTTILPLVEQNIHVVSPFVFYQLLSRCLFIFALCIPFEIRDIEQDSQRGIKTLPFVLGIKKTQLVGIFTIILEIIIHHLMYNISVYSIIALDATSIVALLWILNEKNKGSYFYKFFVDGTMLLRFLFLFLAINFS